MSEWWVNAVSAAKAIQHGENMLELSQTVKWDGGKKA